MIYFPLRLAQYLHTIIERPKEISEERTWVIITTNSISINIFIVSKNTILKQNERLKDPYKVSN